MQLTGKLIIEKGIISGAEDAGIQQQGVDVRLDDVRRMSDDIPGLVPSTGNGKTYIPHTTSMYTEWDEERDCEYYYLEPGYYEISFVESCKIPANCAMYFKTRSSLVRCGAEVRSGQFDGGFETDKMGAFLKVEMPIRIDRGARVAQAIVTETYTVDDKDLYNGQWQGDKQRNS